MDTNEIKGYIQSCITKMELQEAYDLLMQYKKMYKYDDEIASMEAIINIYNSNYDEALKCVKDGLKVKFNSSNLYFIMGNIYELKEKNENAYLCYENALILSTDENEKIIEAIKNLKQKSEIKVNKCSIVILTYNNLDYTKVCIDSIRKYNDKSTYEIIIVDNNSTDGTVEWIKEQKDIKYILNTENKGFPIGCNQGIEIAEKNNDIFLLNNDTIIMPNSIFNLRMGLYSDENVGATGATSNSISYYQQIFEYFDDFDGYMSYAVNNNISNESLYEERVKLVGFAMLIKRQALDKVGLLDERFTPGNFEDDDISLRLIVEGYDLLLCKDAFIYHFGSISFKQNYKAYNRILKCNSEKFKNKWGFYSEDFLKIDKEIIQEIDKEYLEEFNILQIGYKSLGTLLEIKNRFKLVNITVLEKDLSVSKILNRYFNVVNRESDISKLNLEEKYFDYIIIDDEIERFNNPIKILNNIKQYLKPNGYILATMKNINYYSIIQGLINGIWNNSLLINRQDKEEKQFTRIEINEVLKKSGFNNISIKSIYGYIDEEAERFIRKISSISLLDLEEEYKTYKYLVKAKNFSKEYPKLMKKISLLLRRIEFDIDMEDAIKELLTITCKEEIDEKIIIEIVERDIIDKVFILNYLSIKYFENNIIDRVIPLLNKAYEIDKDNLDTNFNLAYVLNYLGEKDIAIKYLENLKNTNSEIENFKKYIRGKINE